MRDNRARCALLTALVALTVVAAPARADDVQAPRWSLALGLRLDGGLDDVAGLALGTAALGLRWRLAPSLTLDVAAIGLAPFGATRDGRHAAAGIGGELALRVTPLPEARVRPWLGTSMGLALFGDAPPFLPGGDVYEGVLAWGGGIDVALGSVVVGLEARYVHLSNGQGLGPHNPAYDGLGGGLTVTVPLTAATAIAGAFARDGRDPDAGREGARVSATPGLLVDVAAGWADAALVTTRVRLAQRLSPHALALVDVDAGTLDGGALVEAGLALVAHVGRFSAGMHVGHRDFVGLGTLVVALQVELHASDEVSLVALGHLEDGWLGTSGRAALGLRAHPAHTVVVDLGVGFDRIGVGGDDRSDPYLGVEWQPLAFGAWRLGLFLERQIRAIDVAGVRLAFDAGADARALARHDAWRRLR